MQLRAIEAANKLDNELKGKQDKTIKIIVTHASLTSYYARHYTEKADGVNITKLVDLADKGFIDYNGIAAVEYNSPYH